MKAKFLAAVLGLSLCSGALAEEITVFAAASMTNVLQQIADDYKKEYPQDEVKFSFASSSVLAKQIEQDAPADLFISADQKWASYLVEKQKTQAANEKIIAKNGLVLIAPADSKLTAQDVSKLDYAALLKDSYMAVGDPEHVPAGRYAKAAFEKLNLWNTVEPRLARAKNVRDALTLVERGESPLGVVYSTDAQVSDKVKVLGMFPADSHEAIVYPAVTLDASKKAEGKRFYDYLSSDVAKAHFKAAGFVLD